jgi:excisionase family DNA binding protein
MDMSSHDQTPDLSLDTALSIREAAAAASVTEKTIRRWIKRGRLHAVKLGGQYQITESDIRQAMTEAPGDNVQRLDHGHPSPRVDMSSKADTGHHNVQPASVDLRPLVDHIAALEQQVQQLTEVSTVWQSRAMQLEAQLKQLAATAESTGEAVEASVSDRIGDQDAEQGSDDTAPPKGIWDRLVRLLTGR